MTGVQHVSATPFAIRNEPLLRLRDAARGRQLLIPEASMVRKGKGSSLVRDKTTYEMAWRLAEMHAEGMTKKQMMAATGLSRSTVNNRLRVWDRLSRSPRVLRKFREGNLSTMEAERLAKHTDRSKMEKEFQLGRPPYHRLSVPEIRRLLESCRATLNRSDEWKQGAVSALRCVLQKEQIPGVWPCTDSPLATPPGI